MSDLISRSKPLTIEGTTSGSDFLNPSKLRTNAKKDVNLLIAGLKKRYKTQHVHFLSLNIAIHGHGRLRGSKSLASHPVFLSKGLEGAVCINGSVHWIQGHEDEDTGTSHIDNDEDLGVECDDWSPVYKSQGLRLQIILSFDEG